MSSIVVVTQAYRWRTGGIQTLIGGLIKAWSEKSRVIVLHDGAAWLPKAPLQESLLNGSLARPTCQADYNALGRNLCTLIENEKPDLVIFGDAGLANYARFLPESVRKIAFVHGNDFSAPWQQTPGQDLCQAIRIGLESCDRIVAISQYVARLLHAITNMEATDVVRVGLPPPNPMLREEAVEVLARVGLWSRGPIVLTVSRLAPRKNHRLIAEALARVSQPFHWVVVGEGKGEEFALRTLIERLGICTRTSIVGIVQPVVLDALYSECSLLALVPNIANHSLGVDSEGFGLVYQEAAWHSKPSIASDCAGPSEAVIHGVTGLHVKPYSVSEATMAIELLLKENNLAKTLGEQARTYVQSLPSLADVAANIITANIMPKLVVSREY